MIDSNDNELEINTNLIITIRDSSDFSVKI